MAASSSSMSALAYDDNIDDDLLNSDIYFSSEVQAAIDQVCPSDDPLDRPDFNPVDHINKLFPNEQSLANIDDVIVNMRNKIRVIDDDMHISIRNQTRQGDEGHESLLEAQSAVQQLFVKIKDIKEKAEISEQMVKDITRDIKQLDIAKRNLTQSITTLNHLHMLVGGVESLQNLMKRREYGEIANLLQGVLIVLDHFKKYMSLPQIKQLSDQVKVIEQELGQQILTDFHESLTGPATKHFSPTQQLADACLVVDVLNNNIKKELLNWFIDLQLAEYLVLFKDSEQIAWLDHIDRRYVYIKKQLILFEEKFGKMFPDSWCLGERIVVRFCEITRKELSKMMISRTMEIDVNLLHDSIKKTINFETLLSRMFTGATLAEKKVVSPVTTSEDKLDSTNPFLDEEDDQEVAEPQVNVQ